MGRMQAEGILTEVVARNFQPMLGRFAGALRKARQRLLPAPGGGPRTTVGFMGLWAR
jgi:hypothetical protein